MREVKEALATTGIEAFPGAWKPTAANATAPDQYIVYTTMKMEAEHWDDEFQRYQVYVYLNLWSRIDPTEALRRIHVAMRQAGFAFSEENDSYNDDTDYHLIAGTWIIETEATV